MVCWGDVAQGGFVVRGFGAEMRATSYVDAATGEHKVAKQSFLDRLLGKGGPKPRIQPSAADAYATDIYTIRTEGLATAEVCVPLLSRVLASWVAVPFWRERR
jgi:hypothetical protein